MSKQEQIEKIKKLLILAHDNPNRDEGEAAKKKSDELLKKHNIRMSEVFENYSEVKKTGPVHNGGNTAEQYIEDVDEDIFENGLNKACDDDGLVGDRRRKAKEHVRSLRNNAIKLRNIRVKKEWERTHPEEVRKQRDEEEKQRKEWKRAEKIERRRNWILNLPSKIFGWTLSILFIAAAAWVFTYVWREYEWANTSNVILGKFINLALYVILVSAFCWICTSFIRMLFKLFGKLKR